MCFFRFCYLNLFIPELFAFSVVSLIIFHFVLLVGHFCAWSIARIAWTCSWNLCVVDEGTSDEHISIVQYLKSSHIDGAIVVTTPQEVCEYEEEQDRGITSWSSSEHLFFFYPNLRHPISLCILTRSRWLSMSGSYTIIGFDGRCPKRAKFLQKDRCENVFEIQRAFSSLYFHIPTAQP